MKNGMMKIGFSRTVARSTRTDAICVIPLWSLPPRRGKPVLNVVEGIKMGVPTKNQTHPFPLSFPVKGRRSEVGAGEQRRS